MTNTPSTTEILTKTTKVGTLTISLNTLVIAGEAKPLITRIEGDEETVSDLDTLWQREHLQAGITHSVDIIANGQRCCAGLTADEGDAVKAAIDTLSKSLAYLQEQRKSLVIDAESARLAAGDAADDDTIEWDEARKQRNELMARSAEAWKLVDEFDAKHPEVVAEIQTRKAADLKRNQRM